MNERIVTLEPVRPQRIGSFQAARPSRIVTINIKPVP